MMKFQYPLNLEKNDPRLNTLAELCCDRIGDLFNDLDVEVISSGNKYIGICPIHGEADNPSALNIYPEGYAVPGWWRCRTKGCESRRSKQGRVIFGKTFIGFIRGCLSNLRLGYHWKKKPDAIYTFPNTLKYISEFLKVDINDIKVDQKEIERRRFINECIQEEAGQSVKVYNGKKIHRSAVRKNLIIPSEYFINRGYSKDILNEYDVGLAKKSKLETKDRVIVPIYNQEEFLIGYTCRSVFEKCSSCNLYHDTNNTCPVKHEANLYSKWRHIDFSPENVLYNYWKAYESIKNTNTAIIVEGGGDVWRLKENGIDNVVGIFGNQLHDGQERLLAKAQTMTMVILLDNDGPGQMGCRSIKEKYGRLYRMYFPKITGKDAGEMNEDAITKQIQPYIDMTKCV